MNYEQLVKHIEAFNLLANIPLPYELRKKIIDIMYNLIETKQKNKEEQENSDIHFELNDQEVKKIEDVLKNLITSANNQRVIDLLLKEAKKETKTDEG